MGGKWKLPESLYFLQGFLNHPHWITTWVFRKLLKARKNLVSGLNSLRNSASLIFFLFIYMISSTAVHIGPIQTNNFNSLQRFINRICICYCSNWVETEHHYCANGFMFQVLINSFCKGVWQSEKVKLSAGKSNSSVSWD